MIDGKTCMRTGVHGTVAATRGWRPRGTGPLPDLAKQLDRHRRVMAEWAQEAIDAGLIDGDAETVGQLFWAGMHRVIMLEIAGKLSLRRSFDHLSKEMVRTLFLGMRPSR